MTPRASRSRSNSWSTSRRFQPHHMPFIKNLGTLGIDATLRLVDPVQYRARVDDFDFDITSSASASRRRRATALRTYFSSQAADIKGSHNLAGIADPAIDALIDNIIAAKTREELTTACRALDRVIRAGRYWIPHWYKAVHRIAYWDVFGRPRRSRAMRAACRKPGGTTRRRRRSSSHELMRECRASVTRRDNDMAAYIVRRILFMIPTLLGIMLVSFVVVQFAPGGPVERVIAQFSGSRHRRDLAHFRLGRAAISARAGRRRAAGDDAMTSKYRGAQGLDPEFIKKPRKAVRLRQAGP